MRSNMTRYQQYKVSVVFKEIRERLLEIEDIDIYDLLKDDALPPLTAEQLMLIYLDREEINRWPLNDCITENPKKGDFIVAGHVISRELLIEYSENEACREEWRDIPPSLYIEDFKTVE